MLHLAIMKERPEMKSVVHCHPPHATAFGIAREPVPQCVLPEVEIFLGDVPITKYEIPGSQEFADTILPFVHKANVIILANHGTVSFGETVEKAYWWTEILDAYCRMLMLARGLGRVNYFTEPEAQALLDLKQQWGFKDPRRGDEKLRHLRQRRVPRELAADRRDSRRPSSRRHPPPAATPRPRPAAQADQEALIQAITDRVMQALSKR